MNIVASLILALPAIVASPPAATPTTGAIDLGLARKFFDEAAALSDRDDGALWGRRLYGPMLFVDPQSRAVVANETSRDRSLTPHDGVFVGTLPEDMTIANTALVWAGRRWTMLVWPLPEGAKDRARLMAHEMWHRIQGDLGLGGQEADNRHLDTPAGRTWLRLEWRAWSRAIETSGDARRDAVADALAFRRMRYELVEGAADAERELENNEGLAEHTGVALAGWTRDERIAQLREDLKRGDQRDSFVRNFAYYSGPAIGFLLDEIKPGWTRHYHRLNHLPDRLEFALRITPPSDLRASCESRLGDYDGKAIRAEEEARGRRRQRELADARAKFVTGPTLRLRLVNMKMQFDPNTPWPLDDVGTIYPTIRINDVWGTLDVTGGALIGSDWRSVTVAVPPDWDGVRTDHAAAWKLDIDWPWRIERAEAGGKWVLTR